MKLQIKKCRTCGALGVGPHANKLWSFEGFMYCAEHFKDALSWDASRPNIIMALRFELATPAERKKWKDLDWRAYLTELGEMAGWALVAGDRRTFVHYFARAMYAWTLKEIE